MAIKHKQIAVVDTEANRPSAPEDGFLVYTEDTDKLYLRKTGAWTDITAGGSGAPTDASYVTTASEAGLSNESVLTAGNLIDLSGATINVDLSEAGAATPAVDDTIPFTDISNSNANASATVETMFYEYFKVMPRYMYRFFTDFESETSTTGTNNALGETNSGTNAAWAAQATGATNRHGVLRGTTGTTATGRASINASLSPIRLAGGTLFFETGINVTTLSTSGERFQLVVGFFDTNTAANQVDAVAFVYDEGGVSTGSTAAAYWQTLTASNSVRTWNTSLTQTTVSAATWVRLGIEINAAATSVSFYINGTSVATHTANIPTGSGRELGFGIFVIKSVGTTARTIDADYINVVGEFTSAR